MSAATARRVRLFLDANVLVSAAWKEGSRVTSLWQIPSVELITSNLILIECERNLLLPGQSERLAQLLRSVRVIEFQRVPSLASPSRLPEKDRHVLAAAVLARAHYLVTGDFRHFGAWYGRKLAGVRVEPPGSFPRILELN
jgi:uncharacterized protein